MNAKLHPVKSAATTPVAQKAPVETKEKIKPGKLYPAQQKMVDYAFSVMQHTNPLNEDHYFINGENGVGKTYITSWLLNKIMHLTVPQQNVRQQYSIYYPEEELKYTPAEFQRSALIIAPKHMQTKWRKVLKSFIPNAAIEMVDRSRLKEGPLNFTPGIISIISNDLHNIAFLGADDKPKKTSPYGKDNLDNLKDTIIVYDEVHEAENSQLKALSRILNQGRFLFLGLTGTPYNADRYKLFDILAVTNKILLTTQQINIENYHEYFDHISLFLELIWQYISLNIEMKDKNTVNKIKQTIEPIKNVPITPAQKAYYQLLLAQQNALSNDHSEKAQQKRDALASQYLDNSERKPYKTIKNFKRKNRKLGANLATLLALPLTPIAIRETPKYKRLQAILDKHNADRVIVYFTDNALIKTVSDALTKDGYTVDTLPTSINPNKYSDYINESLENGCNVFLVNPKNITTGIDIQGKVIVWYQLLPSISDIIQAQNRIHRMSSKYDSHIYYLPYELTYQEKFVDQLSMANKNNAASYGKQDRSELTKITKIYLEELDNVNEQEN